MSDDDKIDKVTGQAKKAAGKVTGDDELEYEGKAQHGMAQAKEAVEDTVEKVQEAVKKVADKATGSGKE